MTKIVLRNTTAKGEPLEVTFLPEMGMNMISYKKGNIEIIDQSTNGLFEERFAGLGALIGPHFHRRKVIPAVADETLFPHIARVKAKGVQEPFSHGIGRYAPWQAKSTETKVNAVLTGKDVWNGVPLATLEGQNFKLYFEAELFPHGLQIEMSVVSDTASIVGLHYYYHLPKGTGTVKAHVQKRYENRERKFETIPSDWNFDSQHLLTLDLKHDYDDTFYPFPNPLEGKIWLDAIDYQLETTYTCQSQENSWQLWHPAGASFVCIEPLSAQDPRHPNLSVSSLRIHLEIK